jgi:hypothetical protein
MDVDINLISELRTRVRELEDKVEALRISRRVLMNLIDSVEKDKKEHVAQLTTRNEQLQRNICRYARVIMCRNVRITELEDQLHSFKTCNMNTSNNHTG